MDAVNAYACIHVVNIYMHVLDAYTYIHTYIYTYIEWLAR